MISIKEKMILFVQPYVSKKLWKIINYFDRKRLKNTDFTILCTNCIGGVLYSRLNQKFCTPFINMWLEDDDLIKFALNIEKYVKEDLIYIKTEYDYPVAKLGDITLYFNHCKSEGEATSHWNKRIGRINKNNLFLIASDRCGMDRELISSFESIKCSGKVMFTSDKNRTESYMLYLPYYEGENRIGIFMNDRLKNYWLVAPFDGVFDYVDFFNSGKINHKNNLRMKVLSYLGNVKWNKWIDNN